MNENNGFIAFAIEKIKTTFNLNDKRHIKWGEFNDLPDLLLQFYQTCPEHSASIDLIESLVVGSGLDVDDIDFWTLKKIILDYIIFGGFCLVNESSKSGSKIILNWLDITRCRLTLDEKYIIYTKKNKYNLSTEVKYYKITNTIKEGGVFYFKNNKSREEYPYPLYISATRQLDTMNNIIKYNQSQSANGFAPTMLINTVGERSAEMLKKMEIDIKNKYQGVDGQRFLISVNPDKDTRTEIEEIQTNIFDESFEILYKTLRNQIIISHKLTSGKLIGLPDEGSGFNKIEYQESLEVFKEVVILAIRKELEYGIGTFLGKDVKFTDYKPVDIQDNTQNITQ